MIPLEFEYLFEKNGYEYYKFDEYGFSNGELALQYHLYEKFTNNYTSTFFEIFSDSLHFDQKISQIWIFKNNIPIALGLTIHYLEPEIITDIVNSELSSSLLGHIQLYVSPLHRKKGLAKEMVPELENALLNIDTQFPPSVVLQDDAYPFKKYLNHLIALPDGEDIELHLNKNIEYMFHAFKEIGKNSFQLSLLNESFPDIVERIKNMRDNFNTVDLSDSLLNKQLL